MLNKAFLFCIIKTFYSLLTCNCKLCNPMTTHIQRSSLKTQIRYLIDNSLAVNDVYGVTQRVSR